MTLREFVEMWRYMNPDMAIHWQHPSHPVLVALVFPGEPLPECDSSLARGVTRDDEWTPGPRVDLVAAWQNLGPAS